MDSAVVGPQPTRPHQVCDCVVVVAESEFGPEGGVRSKAPCWFRVDINFGTEFSPVVSAVGSSRSVLDSSPDDCEELPSAPRSVRMSVAVADATARSRGTLGRPRNGILSVKRLAEGFKAERF